MNNPLPLLFVSRVRAEIFRLLFEEAGHELHLRELQRQAGLALGTIQQDLKKLRKLDLVRARRDGNRLYYSATAVHPLFPEISSIVQKTTGLLGQLKRRLAEPEVRIAFIFGSISTGREHAESDVDLMIVGGVGLRRASSLTSGLSSSVGRKVNPHTYTPAEFARRVREKDHFVTSVLKTPLAFLVGSEASLKELLEEEAPSRQAVRRSG